MQKIIVAEATRCTGCRTCEMVCSVKKMGMVNPARARVHVVRFEKYVLEMPMLCQQCESAPCMNSCPVKAIERDERLGIVKPNYDRCIGCRNCMMVCPFGAIGYDPSARKIYKCDQCDGDPTCVKFCETKALQYVDASTANLKVSRDSARKVFELLQKLGPEMRQDSVNT
jgi:anaerobic carbon-monoxide dehydrogenase iron sulfur subunit